MYEPLLWLGVFCGSIVGAYFITGTLAFLTYSPDRADEPAENVVFTIVTIGSEGVREALGDCISHHSEIFREYPLHLVVDEGADLVRELKDDERVSVTVVPDEYETTASAKGRAIDYYIKNVVAERPDLWYAFIDDDNKVLSRDILYEIPHYEQQGYGAANAVLYPRPGASAMAFIVDHLRTVEDLTTFRLFTGVLGKPLMGFHGELLTVRGDVLTEIGFDTKESLVEDYVFATEIVRRGIPTWQTGSWVSILSPHSIMALFHQRRRWYLGLLQEQLHSPLSMRLVMGVRLVPWTLGLLGGITLLPIWAATWVGLLSGIGVPLEVYLLITGLWIAHLASMTFGAFRLPDSIVACVGHAVMIPVYATIELLSVPYALLTANRLSEFEVIDK